MEASFIDVPVRRNVTFRGPTEIVYLMLIAWTLSTRFSSGRMNTLAPTKSGNLFKNLFQIRVLLVEINFWNNKLQGTRFAIFFFDKILIERFLYYDTEMSDKIKFQSISIAIYALRLLIEISINLLVQAPRICNETLLVSFSPRSLINFR